MKYNYVAYLELNIRVHKYLSARCKHLITDKYPAYLHDYIINWPIS